MEIKDIEKLAELAKIELTDVEKQALLKDLDGILGYVKQITEADLPAQTGVPDIEQEYENRNIWREDVIDARDFDRDWVAGQFPDAKDGFVKVKKIM